jgi:hypothetical protein
MISQKARLSIILILAIFLLVPAISSEFALTESNDSFTSVPNNNLHIHEGGFEVAGTQDEASWWNSTFIYRRYFNFTEPGITDRTLTPVHLYLTFEDGHCYKDSIRVGYYQDPTWTMLPFQTWNTTYYSGSEFIESTTVSFMVNVSQSQREENYYIYYAKIDVGSVSHPNFYPFIYKSFTFSLINLVSYYDDNNYLIEMWDSSSEIWDDPRNVDSRWSSAQVNPSNVPYGTLDELEVVRYEPTSYSYTVFRGYYAVYSNYPLGVSMGQGNMGSNPAINDWFPGVNELGSGIGTNWIFGGVEGFESRNEGKYWIQATENDTEVWAWASDYSPDTGWKFHNNSDVSSWPAILDAGEYVSKRDVLYTTYMKVNSTKPVHLRQGDSDCTYARDIWAFYPSITGALAGEEFYTIDMGHSNDRTRVTNLGDTSVQVDWWRNSGSGFGTKNTIPSIAANNSYLINHGSSGSSDQEDILHIKGPPGSMLMVEGIYNPTTSTDAGDWVPTVTGHRFGTRHKLWGINSYKFIIVATENAYVDISGYNDGTLEIPAGGMAEFRPLSSGQSLYHIESNASIGVLDLGKFSTSSPYNPTGDTGYGWMVPTYHSDEDSDGFTIEAGEERHLFEFDITVVDLDGIPIEGASVTLYNGTYDTLWEDDNGKNRIDTTDANGLVVFEGLNNGTYNITTVIDAANWLDTTFTHVWVRESSDHEITGSVTAVEIELKIASIELRLRDLMDDYMLDTLDESTTLRVCNSSNYNQPIDQKSTNETGWVRFYRIPKDDYNIYVDYSGPVASYKYDDLLKFWSKSISASEFNGGSFVYDDWKLPLITLDIHVRSWDDQPVESAVIIINNENESGYSLQESSNEDGNYSFYRIVNGTWSIDVQKDDDYPGTLTATNDTVVLYKLQTYTEKVILLPITQLRVRVKTGAASYVDGALVNVTLVGGDVVAQGTTNGSGLITFFYIHGNMSNPYSVSYNLTAESGGTVGELIGAKCDYLDWTFINNITLTPPVYSEKYTFLNSTVYSTTLRWGRNTSFLIGYYDRDDAGGGAYTDTALNLDENSWLNFTIHLESTFIGKGTWNWSYNDGFVVNETDGEHFNITIDTDYWLMHVSDVAYTIRVYAHSDPAIYDDPALVTVYITVQPAQTQAGKDSSAINEYYSTHADHLYWLYDSTNDENISSLAVYTYNVVGTSRSGSLIDEMDGTYSFSKSILNKLAVGTYTLVIELQKRNYVNHTINIPIQISLLPMVVDSIIKTNYTWIPSTQVISFQYDIEWNTSSPTVDLTGVNVIVRWYTQGGVSYRNDTLSLDATLGVYTYTFSGDILQVGIWNFTISCSKNNYELAIGKPIKLLEVYSAPTDLEIEGTPSDTVEWQESVVFDVNFTRQSDEAGLTGASFSHNWTDIVSLDHLSAGIYRVTVYTGIEAATYTLNLTMSKENHEDSWVEFTIEILVPLLIESDYASAETPIEVYWTQPFSLEIVLKDISRSNQPVDGATVSYEWYLEFVVDESDNLDDFTGGIYNTTLNAFDAIPNSPPETPSLYSIIITANKIGSTEVQTTIFLKINAVPNKIVLKSSYFEAYYADVFDVRFYWNNTLDNESITNPDDSSYTIVNPPTDIGAGMNYGNGTYSFTVDSRSLQMTPAVGGTVYVIQITMEKEGFQEHSLTTVIVLVRETPASLIIDSIDDVNWSDSFDITATLYDAYHDVIIDVSGEIDTAVLTLKYGTNSQIMTNNLDGTFSVTLDSEDWFAANPTPHTISFEYSISYFLDSVNSTTVKIDPVEAEVQLSYVSATEVTWGEDLDVIVVLNNTYAEPDEFFTSDNVYYEWSAVSVQGSLSYTSPTYQVTIDTSEVPAGDYILYIRALNENFTITDLVIPVTVNPVSTIFESDQVQYSIQYGITGLEIILTYKTLDEIALPDATVSMIYAGVTRTATYDSDDENYILSFNPSIIDNSYVPGELSLNITASKQNYTSAEIHPTLKLIMRTTLTGLTPVALDYADIYTLNVQWNALNASGGVDNPDSAQVILCNRTHVITQNITGLADLGDGAYRITLNTDSLGMDAIFFDNATRYTLKIRLIKDGYVTGSLDVVLLVSQTSTEMSVEPIAPITWSEDFTIIVHLNDSEHDLRIHQDAVVTFTYGEFSSIMTSGDNGTFYITENSRDIFSAGVHTTIVTWEIPNYQDGSIEIDITVDPVEAELFHYSGSTESYDGTWRDIFSMEVGIREITTQLRLPQTSVTYSWVEYPNIGSEFTYDSDADSYAIDIDTEEVPAGTLTLRISATLMNYSIQHLDVAVTLDPFAAVLVADEDVIYAIFGVTESRSVHLSYASTQEDITGATVTFRWAGQTRSYSTYDDVENRYVFDFNPSADESLTVPGYVQLNFTASLQNFTMEETTILLRLSAATEIRGEDKSVEAESSFLIEFQYWDTTNDASVPGATVQYRIGDGELASAGQANTTGWYRIELTATPEDLPERDLPYQIRIFAEASGYQNWTASEPAQIIQVTVTPVMIRIPIPLIGDLIGPIERDYFYQFLMLTGGFVLLVGLVVGVRRWRVPFQIKQINKAMKAIDKGKTAKVEGIKSMGGVVSDLLALGLADLAIEAPMIDMGPEPELAVDLGEEAGELLDELEALDEIGVGEPEVTEEPEDFEAELAAELEEIIEEEAEPEVEPTEEAEVEAELEAEEPEISEEEPEEAPTEEPVEVEEEEPSEEIEEVEAEEPELMEEEVEPEELEEEISEAEPEAEEPEPEIEEPEEEFEELIEEPEEPEAEESPSEIDVEEPEATEELLEEEPEEEVTPEADTRAELIANLPEHVKDSFTEEDLAHLTDEELEVLASLSEEELAAFKEAHTSDEDSEE